MTAERQERYGWRPGMAFFALSAALFAAFSVDFAANAATTERVGLLMAGIAEAAA